LASPEDTDILVSQEDFDQALRNLVPSVSQSEMDHYAMIRQTFSGLAPDINASSSGSQLVDNIKAGNSKGKGRATE
jgi:peroxin-6